MDESVQKHIEESLPKVGQFQAFAEAMLRGCALTKRARHVTFDGAGGACALGALYIGMGWAPVEAERSLDFHPGLARVKPLSDAYRLKHGKSIVWDHDMDNIDREQIAARIAAL